MNSNISLPPASRIAPAVFNASASFTRKDIDVWRLKLIDLQHHETALLGLLDRHEAAGMSSRLRALSRAALRLLLGAYLECSPETVCLQTGAHGKPGLNHASRQGNARNIRFNLSHSGHVALVILAIGCELGVDVERLRPVPRCLEIARRYFSLGQYRQIQNASLKERDECFLRLWSRNEAKEKLSGHGIRLLGAKPRMDRQESSTLETRDISWHDQDGEFYIATLAVATGTHRIRHWTLP